MTIATMVSNILPFLKTETEHVSILANDSETRELRAAIEAAGRDIATRADWQRMIVSTDVAKSLTEIDLPSNFLRFPKAGGLYVEHHGTYLPAQMVMESTMWDFITETGTKDHYATIRQGKIKFSPNTGSGVKMTYIRKEWLYLGDTWAGSITSSDMTPAFPEELLMKATIWRWRRQRGLDYQDEMGEFEADLITANLADRGSS